MNITAIQQALIELGWMHQGTANGVWTAQTNAGYEQACLADNMHPSLICQPSCVEHLPEKVYGLYMTYSDAGASESLKAANATKAAIEIESAAAALAQAAEAAEAAEAAAQADADAAAASKLAAELAAIEKAEAEATAKAAAKAAEEATELAAKAVVAEAPKQAVKHK